MEDYFFTSDQDLWGFKMPHEGDVDLYLERFTTQEVKKVTDAAFRSGWELRYLPKMLTPCIYVNTPDAMLHYFLCESDAIKFRDNILYGAIIEPKKKSCFNEIMMQNLKDTKEGDVK